MLQSHVIEADGVFLGAAVRLDTGYRFVAVDLRVEPLDETTWPDLATVQRLVRHLHATGRFPPGPRAQPGVVSLLNARRGRPRFGA